MDIPEVRERYIRSPGSGFSAIKSRQFKALKKWEGAYIRVIGRVLGHRERNGRFITRGSYRNLRRPIDRRRLQEIGLVWAMDFEHSKSKKNKICRTGRAG